MTGSARGIGRAIALRYASLGASVVINYSADKDNARRTLGEVEDAGGRGIVVQADASSFADLDQLFATAIDTFGSLDIVVANAGREVIGQPAIEVTEEEFDRVFAVNSKGAFFTLVKGAKLVSDGGRLIYVGSSSTLSPYPGMGLYSSSRAAQSSDRPLRRPLVHVTAPVHHDGPLRLLRREADHHQPLRRAGSARQVTGAARPAGG